MAYSTETKGRETGDSFMRAPDVSEFQNPAYPAPDWLRHAVIMELPVRTFNHPNQNNPEKWESPFGSASYLSVVDRLAFLRDLGVNVICLYSIYYHTPATNLYAMRHHEAAPDLGTVEDVKTLIGEAHKQGFHVISNTNHYGVDRTSPMIAEHPDWFLPEEEHLYGQRIFDLNHPDVVPYIIDTHTWWCKDVGLDGWRIDVAFETYRKYIWNPILENCAAAGKQILLATEGAHLSSHIRGAGWYRFPISLDMENPNAGWDENFPGNGFVESYDDTTAEDPYRLKDISSHNSTVPMPYNSNPQKCSREGAYQVKGRRFRFGHNLMFAPFVPWLMHGDLFNATHYGVPGLLRGKVSGKLLHAYLNWDDLETQADVVQDFKKIMRIRMDHRDIFHNSLNDTRLMNIPFSSSPPSDAKPYARFIRGKKAALVIGNDNTARDVSFCLQLPLAELGFGDRKELTLTDLWSGRKMKISAEKLAAHRVVVPRDRSAGGGVRVLILE